MEVLYGEFTLGIIKLDIYLVKRKNVFFICGFASYITRFKSFCGLLLITFTISLDQDQARQIVRPDLGPNCLTDGISECMF